MTGMRIRSFIKQLVTQERSPHKLALTCAFGVYIGISPLVGLHTAMTFLFGWMFSLNIATLFAISVFINNPWTMIPVYSLDHLFGKWLFTALHIDYLQLDPVWVESCNLFLKEHTGITGLSLTAFLVGGNILGIIIGAILYPCAKRMFSAYALHTLLAPQE